MRLVCEECRKVYEYDVDDFCPRCGAYNQPKKTWGVDSMGNVVRVDGVNEANHRGSFVHKEVHKEKAQRRVTGMDRDSAVKRAARRSAADMDRTSAVKQSVQRAASERVVMTRRKTTGKKQQEGTALGAFMLIIFLVQLLRSCAGLF